MCATKNTWRVYRGEATSGIALPLQVIAAGRHGGSSGGRDVVKRRAYHQLFWVTSGRIDLKIDGHVLGMGAGTVALAPAGTVHGVSAFHDRAAAYSFKLTGPAARIIVEGFGLSFGTVFDAGDPPPTLLERLHASLSCAGPPGDLSSSAAAYELLSCVAGRVQFPSTGIGRLVRRALAIVERDLGDCGLNVSGLASRLDVHRSLLARRFAEQMGVTPKDYIRARRLSRAMALLQDSDLSIACVARECGCASSASFARTVRRATGMTPSEIRGSL